MIQKGSAAVSWTEIDLTTIVPAVSTTAGALAGVFRWGPLDSLVLADSESLVASRFGKPTNFNAETWFTAANFLAYGNRLYLSRAGDYTGNTVEKSFVGNTINLAAQAGNNIVQLSNTTHLLAGMRVFHSNAAGVPDDSGTSNVFVTSVVNSTAVALSVDATANVEALDLVFREDVVYTAVAQEIVDRTIDWDGQTVKNDASYHAVDGTFDPSVLYVARYAGAMGDSLRISSVDTAAQFSSNLSLAPNAEFNSATSVMTATVGSNVLHVVVSPANTANATQVSSANALADSVRASIAVTDLVLVGNTRVGTQHLKVSEIGALSETSNVFSFSLSMDDEVKLRANVTHGTVSRYWEFFNLVKRAPGLSDYTLAYGNSACVDETHLVVVDEDGAFSSSPGTVLEVFESMSRATDSKTVDGGTNYVKNVINQGSKYLWWANDREGAVSNTAAFLTSATTSAPLNVKLYGGSDGPDEATVPVSVLTFAYDKFASPEDVDVSLVLQGKARGEGASDYTTLGNYLIDNICETRKDCVAFVSPDKDDVVNNYGNEVTDVLAFRNNLRSTSYAVGDSGYKYQYDRYNDVYRWVPLNGDIAGLCVRTDQTNDAWWSPAGYKRGRIKNVVRLAFNPRKSERDSLYNSNINPVVSQVGEGPVLLGDKTLLTQSSAFDRINVRRLFIVLEKAISQASKYTLFEFNDDFTRAQFKSMVVPFLKDVQGRRGIYDFLVKCDGDNNPPEVVDSYQFVGDIYVKPARSISYVQLNFIAVRTGVAFSEVVGKW